MTSFRSRFLELSGPLGLNRVCKLITSRTPKILMYHRFSDDFKQGYMSSESFERQVIYLKNNFNVMTLRDLMLSYEEEGVFPVNAVVITVDDGYRDFYDLAYPILKRQSIPATFFITTRFIDGDFWLWPDKVAYVIEHSHVKVEDLPDVHLIGRFLDDRNNSASLWGALIKYLLSINENDKNQWIKSFAKVCKVNIPERPCEKYIAINWNQAFEMSVSGIEIGPHTRTHPSLGHVNTDQLTDEIVGSINDIKSHLGVFPLSFCYPNGQPADITTKAKEIIEKAGCLSAVTAYYDSSIINDRFEMRRFNVSSRWANFLRVVNGVDVLLAKTLSANNILHHKS